MVWRNTPWSYQKERQSRYIQIKEGDAEMLVEMDERGNITNVTDGFGNLISFKEKRKSPTLNSNCQKPSEQPGSLSAPPPPGAVPLFPRKVQDLLW
jgi:hypothetical protein